jgi:DNA polymerase III delta prime subunit
VIAIDTDWYGFGMLAARCFHSLEDLAGAPAHDLNRRVAEIFSNDRRGQSPLTPHERNLIMELVRPDRANRLKDPARIVAAIDRAISHLAPQSHLTVDADPDSALYVICNSREWSDPQKRNGDRRSSDRLKRNGFRPDKARPQADYDSEDPSHVAALKAWLAERFRRPILYRQPRGEFWLQGDRFALRVKSDDRDPRNPPWTFAFADVLDSIGIPEQATFSDLRGVPLVFLTTRDDRNAFHDRRNWTPYLPPAEVLVEDRNQARETLVRFLRCTNQLDLLLCYAEIFPCDVVPLGSEHNVDRVRVTPRVIPNRGLPPWLRKANDLNLFSYFRQRLDGSSPEEKHVTLTRDDGIRVFVRDARDDEWDLERIESMAAPSGEEPRPASLILMRQGQADKPGRVVLPHGAMFIRASDHYGQVELIDRRGKAIEKVTEFRYLLNALASPKPVWMTTSIEKLPLTLDMETVDENKRSVLLDILSARPIYALQGPPGTGKTTLIAHLSRQILQEDQTAQILITAQAHGAVERLQETLQRINAGDDDNPALVVRLGIDDDERADGVLALPSKEGAPLSLREQAVAILQKASAKLTLRSLAQAPRPSSVEADWILTLGQMIKASVIGSDASGTDDFSAFKRLIRDGANIVLCTTSARDLEEIAAGDKTFDWSIVEEAGRVHGYDLALPMNVGHRWLLVGDQQQLEAYRYEQFKEALQFDEMDESTQLLKTLYIRNPDLVDREWPGDWDEMKLTSNPNWTAQAFLGRAKSWLRTFDNIYKILKASAPEDRPTEEKEIGSAVGRLVNQYRMHPAIGTLVSQTYYRDQGGVFVSNRTGTIDDPSPKVLHGLDAPSLIKDLPIVWLDVPWCGTPGSPPNAREQRATSYWNQAEIELIVGFCRQLSFKKEPERPLQVAVLSQYMAQKNRLQTRLRDALPNGFGPGLRVKEGLYGRQRTVEQLRFTHTVDSFQGNEADVVIVSLTRNNTRSSLGFVKDAKRMNVLLSRAQRLLVLVGSWDFFQRQVDGLQADVNWRHELAHIKRMLTILEEFERRPVPAFVRLRWSDGAFRRLLR